MLQKVVYVNSGTEEDSPAVRGKCRNATKGDGAVSARYRNCPDKFLSAARRRKNTPPGPGGATSLYEGMAVIPRRLF